MNKQTAELIVAICATAGLALVYVNFFFFGNQPTPFDSLLVIVLHIIMWSKR